MNPMQNAKFVSVTPPAAIIDNAAVTTAAVDCAGWGYAVFTAYFGAMDIAATVFKLTECETSGGSYTDVPGADFSVLPLTVPSATDDNKGFRIFVKTKGVRKRFLDLSVTIGDGAAGDYVAIWCDLFLPVSGDLTASGRGLDQNAIV